MESLNNKIDFAVILSVKNANPNGDPLNGNRPRVNYDGFGEISDVCIKRKIRNRLLEADYPIFVQSDDNKVDDCKNLRERAETLLKANSFKDSQKFAEAACQKWIDVRAFGQVFAYADKSKKSKKKTEEGEEPAEIEGSVSIGIRGPVSIHPAFSLTPINTTSIQITKSVSGEGEKKAPDTMGMKHRVDFGLYVFYGSINPQLASKTGFNDEDAEAIKQALIHLFNNDASSARPEGSMEVVKVYWWKHNCKNGQYSSANVHRTLHISLQPGIDDPRNISDYLITTADLDGLVPEVYDGQ
jgi:CRISPR-associated protein Csd2